MANLPNGGKKSDYVERLKRQRTTSAVKFYLIAIILGGLIGLAYIKRAEIKSVYDSLVNSAPPASAPEPKAPVEAPKVVEAAPVVEPKKITQPVVTVPPKPPEVIQAPAVSAKDEAAARKLLVDGKALLEKFDFVSASKDFEDAAKLKIGAPLKTEASTLAAKASAFQNATKHIATAEYASSENAVVVELNDGSEWRGVKVKDDENVVGINVLVDEARPAAEGRQRYEIPKVEVKRVVSIPLSKRRSDFAELVAAIESGTTVSQSTDYYDLVYLTKRLGLGAECVKYLNRAFDGGPGHAADPDLGDSYRREVIKRAMSRATLLMAGNRRPQVEAELNKLRATLPGFAAVDEEIRMFRKQVMDKVGPGFAPSLTVNDNSTSAAKPAPKKAPSDPAEKPKQLQHDSDLEVRFDHKAVANGPAAKIVERMNVRMSEGMQMINNYRIGVGGNKEKNNHVLMDAKKLFTQVIDDCDEALRMEPGNGSVQSAQQHASMMVYFCNKNMIL